MASKSVEQTLAWLAIDHRSLITDHWSLSLLAISPANYLATCLKEQSSSIVSVLLSHLQEDEQQYWQQHQQQQQHQQR